jgi:hypothetical protein
MALIVENGTGLSTAESYVSVADAGTRHTNLGNTAWTGTDAVKEAALRRATQYMLQTYRGRWHGERINGTQALDWPRSWVTVDGYAVDADIVPTDIANACADLALRALAADLAADLTRGVVREKVGPLETEYDRNSPQSVRYRAIDMMLAPYLTRGAGGSMMVVRT